MPEKNKPIRWNLDFMGLKLDPGVVSKRALDKERLAGIIDGAGLAVDYAYDLLDERRSGTELDKAFRRAVRALDKLSKALEGNDGGDT